MALFKDIYQVLKREIQLFISYRSFSLLSVGLPLLAVLYFVVLMNRGVATDIPIAIYDQDNTPLSRQLTRMIDAASSPKVAYYLSDMLEGEDLMRKGKIDAIVAIPRDLEKDVYATRQAQVMVYINGANVIKAGLLDANIRTVLYSFSAGVEAQTLISKGISPKQAADMMMPIAFEGHILFNPYINYGYYLLPIFLSIMMLFFALLATIFTFGTELKNGTAPQWLAVANGNMFAAFFGKTILYTFIFALLNVFVLTVMFEFLGVPFNGSRTLLVLANFLFIIAYQNLGVLIVALCANLRLSLSIGGGYSVLAFTFSGMTFPTLGMLPVIKVLSYLFPLTFYMNIFVDQAMRGAPALVSLPDMLWLTLFTLLPLPLLPRLKRLATDARYWGRL